MTETTTIHDTRTEQLWKEAVEKLKEVIDLLDMATSLNLEQRDLETANNFYRDIAQLRRYFDYFDAAHAYLAHATKIGKQYGRNHASKYLAHELNITQREANVRVARGRAFFEEQKKWDETTKQQAAHCREIFRRGELPMESIDNINMITRKLKKDSTITQPELRLEAMEEAKNRTPEDVRVWMRHRYRNNLIPEKDKKTPRQLRRFRMGEQDEQGGVRVSGYLPTDYATRLAHILNKESKKLLRQDKANLKEQRKTTKTPTTKIRTTDQAMADALNNLAKTGIKEYDANNDGTASLVISIPIDKLTNETNPTFLSSTGYILNPDEILRLIGTKYEWLALHDPVTGFPLNLMRTERLATIYQKLALFAHQGVCTGKDCDICFDRNEAHHITSWANGGNTDLENLTLTCTNCNLENDDNRTKPNSRHIERDPETKETGFIENGKIQPPRSFKSSLAAGNYIKNQHNNNT